LLTVLKQWFWVPSPAPSQEVTLEEAESAVKSYTSEETTPLLQTFGQLLLEETETRSKQIDWKATLTLGYAGVVIGFLGSRTTRPLDIAEVFIVAGATLALVAIVFASAALWMHNWMFPSERDWLRKELLNSPQDLRRYYVLVIHQTKQHNHRVNQRRATALERAQRCLAYGAIVGGTALLFR
jgi:hypothetical protein